MPGGDRTGPNGMGSMTGRGLGFCNGYSMPGLANRGFRGRGFGMGFGRGYGRRMINQQNVNVPNQNIVVNPEQEKDILENQLKQIDNEENILNQEKEEIKKRLEELNN